VETFQGLEDSLPCLHRCCYYASEGVAGVDETAVADACVQCENQEEFVAKDLFQVLQYFEFTCELGIQFWSLEIRTLTHCV